MLGLYSLPFRFIIIFFISLAFLCSLSSDAMIFGAVGYKPAVGQYEVKTLYLDLHDSARNRDVPVKIYYPSFAEMGAQTCFVIIFSHGLGGSRDGYEYLGRRWAGIGYISVHPQHIGSDEAVWKDNSNPFQNMRRAAMAPMNAVNRAEDIHFLIDRLEDMNRTDKIFKGRLDLSRLGVAGHSFGANTAMMIAGQKAAVNIGLDASYADPRVKAIIAMSAPVPRKKVVLDKVYSGIKIPAMHMTGTKDDSPIGGNIAAERRVPYDHIKASDQFLITFDGGDHMIFSGRLRIKGDDSKDALFQDYIMAATTTFWDAYLRGDQEAKNWLTGGGFEKYLGSVGTFEKK